MINYLCCSLHQCKHAGFTCFFRLTFILFTQFSQTKNQSFYTALGQKPIRRLYKKQLTDPSMSSISFNGRSFLFWCFLISYCVKGNTCYIISPIFLFHCYSHPATIFTFDSSFLFIFYSTDLTEVYPMLIPCRTMACRNTLPS